MQKYAPDSRQTPHSKEPNTRRAKSDFLLPDLLSLTSVPGMRAGHKLASEGPDTRAVQHYLGLGCVKGTHVPTINYRGRS